MAFLWIALSVFFGTAKSLLSKGLKTVNSVQYGLSCSNVLIFIAAFAVILVYGCIAGVGAVSSFTLILSVLYALSMTAAMALYMKALEIGDVSVTAFIYACGFLLPTVAGILFWREALSPAKATGILLLLLALFCIVSKPKSAEQQTEKTAASGIRWQLCSIGAMLMSGFLGIIQKTHQTSAYSSELVGFLLIAMSLAVLISLLMMFLARGEREQVNYTPKDSAKALICGIFFGSANILNLSLTGKLPATIQFPLVNGGNIILTAVMGKILFHEKLTKLSCLGILLGIIAIIVIFR